MLDSTPHCLSLDNVTLKQGLKIKSSIVDANNRLIGIFNSLHKELSSSFRFVDTFQNHFSFNSVDWKIDEAKCAHLQKVFEETVVIISDASIKNQVATSIAHIHCGHNIVAKTIHHAVNITLTEAIITHTLKFQAHETTISVQC